MAAFNHRHLFRAVSPSLWRVYAQSRRLLLEVDEAAGVVSLLLKNGVLRRGGVESTITAEGFRMLLPKVTPKQALDIMLGMVVTK